MRITAGYPTIPEVRLAKLIQDLRIIFEDYGYGEGIIPNPTTSKRLAKLLGYEGPENGEYHKKLAALKAYHLLEGYRDVKISELGKMILTTDGPEGSEAYSTAALSFQLWNDLYERFKTLKLREVQPNKVRAGLMEITTCSEAEAQACQARIVAWFDEDVSPIRAIGSSMVIHITAGKHHITYPFAERAQKRAISWLRKVKISA